MFKSIRKNYVSGGVVVNGLHRVTDDRGVPTHYVASLQMRLEGKARTIFAEFYPEQAEELCEIIGIASLNQHASIYSHSWNIIVQVDLMDLRKARFSKHCTAKLVKAAFAPAVERVLKSSSRYYLPKALLRA